MFRAYIWKRYRELAIAKTGFRFPNYERAYVAEDVRARQLLQPPTAHLLNINTNKILNKYV